MKKTILFLTLTLILLSFQNTEAQTAFTSQSDMNKRFFIYTEQDQSYDDFKEIVSLIKDLPMEEYSLDRVGVFVREKGKLSIVPNYFVFNTSVWIIIMTDVQEGHYGDFYQIDCRYPSEAFPFTDKKEMMQEIIVLLESFKNNRKKLIKSNIMSDL